MLGFLKKGRSNHLKVATEESEKTYLEEMDEKLKEAKNNYWLPKLWIFNFPRREISIDPFLFLKNILTFKKILFYFGVTTAAVSLQTAVFSRYAIDVMNVGFRYDSLYGSCQQDANFDKKQSEKFEMLADNYSTALENMETSFAYILIPVVFGSETQKEKERVTLAAEDIQTHIKSCSLMLKTDSNHVHNAFRRVDHRMLTTIKINSFFSTILK